MRIFIAGAGAVASVLSQQLAKDKEISKVVCGSNDLKRAKEFINTRNKKVSIVKLDLSNDQQLVKTVRGFDLIINASLPRFNLVLMKAALTVGANYQDLASELADLKTAEQLKLHKQFKKAGLVALINTGVAPGITNLLARKGADKLENIDQINIRLIEDQIASELIFAWSIETTVDEVTAPPLVYRKGKFQLTKPFHNPEDYDYGHGFGIRRMYSIYGDEVSTLPFYIKTKNIDYKSCGTDIDFAKALHRLGLFNKKPVTVGCIKVIPVNLLASISPKVPSPAEMLKLIKNGVIENAVFSSLVECIGTQSGKKIRIRNIATFPDLKGIMKKFPGATYISYPTGIAAYAFSKVIKHIQTPGVFPPEALDFSLRRKVLLELELNGITFEEEFSKA